MAQNAKKTEHAGAKKGSGAYGMKVAAKKESNKKRRENDKTNIREFRNSSR